MRMSTSDSIGYSGEHYGKRVDKDIERENKKLDFTDLSLVLKWPIGGSYSEGCVSVLTQCFWYHG